MYVSDSSQRIQNNQGRVSFPAKWELNNIGREHSLLTTKPIFKSYCKELIENEIAKKEEYYKIFDISEPVTLESFVNNDNKYPGGRKIKNMKNFYTCRNTVPVNEFFEKCKSFNIRVEYFENNVLQTFIRTIKNNDDILHTEAEIQNLKNIVENYTGPWIKIENLEY
jgi:hypothetical protein